MPNLGYEVNEWYLDGNSTQIGGETYTLTNITADHIVYVTFKLEQLEFTISGTITCAGSALVDVNMVGLSVVTDINGFYSATVDSGWSGVGTPAKDDYTFDPNSRSYINVTTDQVNQDYDALPWDHFDDARRSSMWWSVADGDTALAWLDEDTNNLNMRAFGLPPSCVGHWKMDDNAANPTVVDDSGNGNDGTAQQNTDILHTTGKIDGALTFNGTSDCADVGDVVGPGAYTKVAWVKRDAGDYYNNIVSSGDVWSHAIYAPYTQSFRLCAGHEHPFNQVQDSVPLDVNVWYQVAVTFDPNVSLGRMVLYKDGVQVDDANNVPTHSASTSTYIGRFVSGYWMNGAIDNVMIFNRALTTEEIADLYAEDTKPEVDWAALASSCTGHWRMNDNVANPTVVDDSGNGNDGTAQQNTDILHTTGKIDGALTFNGTSDCADVGDVVGPGAYTKVAWVKRDAGDYYNNIVSSGDVWSHAIYAPYTQSFRLCAGHEHPFNQVQDSVPLDVNVWYQVAVTFDPNVSLGRMVLYKDGVQVDDANNVPTHSASTSTYIGRFVSGYWMNGAIDNVMIFNRALTTEEIEALYNEGNGTETLSSDSHQAHYVANGWSFDVAEDLEVKVDFHHSDVSMADGWVGMSVGDDVNYVSISAGADSNGSYFYYEAVVDGNLVSEREARIVDDGTLYVSYDATLREFYLSHKGFGSENAYVWQTSNPLQGQWAFPVDVSIGGGSSGAALSPGEAYLDNFEMAKATLLGWPPATDIDGNGFIELYDLVIMCGNWLDTGAGDIDNDGDVDFIDFAELGLAW